MHQGCEDLSVTDLAVACTRYSLSLSFKPLFALRMAFRECDVFFLGTASSHGGKSSSREGSAGMAHENFGAAKKAGRKATASDMRASGARMADSHELD